jgi:hypothetical protein
MSGGANNDLGSVVALWRYPVKSMMGEERMLQRSGNAGSSEVVSRRYPNCLKGESKWTQI